MAGTARRPRYVGRHRPPGDRRGDDRSGLLLRLALLATAIGFVLGSLFGFVAGYFRNSVIDRLASVLSVFGVSVPHYWLGMLLVILCSVKFALLPATGGGPIGEVGWQWDWAHLQFMLLPAITLSVIPTGIIARTVRSQVADILSQEFIVGLRARGLNESRIFVHVMKMPRQPRWR